MKLGPKGKTLHIDINTYAKSPSLFGILEYIPLTTKIDDMQTHQALYLGTIHTGRLL